MSNQPASDRALRGALSLPGVNAGASRAILVSIEFVQNQIVITVLTLQQEEDFVVFVIISTIEKGLYTNLVKL